MRVRLLGLSVLAVVVLGPASARAASWSPQATVLPSGAVASPLRSVACPTARFCVAVGTTGPTFAPGASLIERWDGARWAIDPIPLPSGIRSAELRDVACTSARSCLAVGTASGSTTAGFAERWDGIRWTPLAIATPTGASGTELRGVSCVARRCVAVGVAAFPLGPPRNYELPRPLVERWNGSRWTVQPTPDVTGSTIFNTALDDVSCSRGDACTAVGLYLGPGGGEVPLVERWDGRAWTVQDTPAIPDQVSNRFSAVSCPRRRYCEAVGYVSTTKTTEGVAERWDGIRWSREATPGPLSGPSQLLGVTCAARGRCSAVGEVLASPTGNGLPLTVRRTAVGWRVEAASLPPGGTFGRLWGVSCAGAGRCTSVGWWGTAAPGLRPLAERRAP